MKLITVHTNTPTAVKPIPASTNAYVNIMYGASAWRLVGYGTL